MATRRRDKRVWFLALGIFSAVFLFSFLTQKFKSLDESVEAASLANFDPGYIISDYQMGNYNSMSEAEIQKFLTSKNPCSNRDHGYYQRLSANNPNVKWHFSDGHFVCLSEELFGDGEVIGSGETAAHIIWQAAQDYKINPQVLIVLLQKESGLITDPIPNNVDYRTATGYGCPDTAPCSSEYFGLKNQIRKAAALFRTVLDGGWTNYPLGNNYIQYNPSASCGGSVVNIRSLATSALYRYTPYQPNAGAIAAGYGTAECGAYGNRNFYLYFEDWFGGVTRKEVEVDWQEMQTPRRMTVKVGTVKINPASLLGYASDVLSVGQELYFASKIDVVWNGDEEPCLRTEYDTNNNNNKCVLMSRLGEYLEPELNYTVETIEPVLLKIKENTFKYDLNDNSRVQEIKKDAYLVISFAAKIVKDGVEYYQTSYDALRGNMYAIPSKSLASNIEFVKFVHPRNLATIGRVDFVEIGTDKVCRSVERGYVSNYVTKAYFSGETYYRTKSDTEIDANCAVKASYVEEVSVQVVGGGSQIKFSDFLWPRNLKFEKDTRATNLNDGTSCDEIFYSGDIVKFITKVDLAGKTYFRTEESSKNNSYCAFSSRDLMEIQ